MISGVRLKSVGDDDLHRAALLTLDTVASAIAARHSRPGQILLSWARGQGGDAGRIAFAFGALAHILEMDDLHRASIVHPGCVVVPAAYAVARREGIRGRDFLIAILHGYEVACRVGMSVGPAHYRTWHNTATCGPFGSAMAVSHLLQLDDDTATHALGNAGTQSSGLWEFLRTGAMTKHLHAGRAAESGLVAADLAALGFTGPPQILEGERGFFRGTCPDARPENVLRRASEPWQLVQTSVKPWPSCRHTHPAIAAALSLASQVAGHPIERVEVRAYRAALDLCDNPDPETEYEAKFSLQHTVAVALREGALSLSSFDDDARARSHRLRARVRVGHSAQIESAYPAAWGAEVSVELADGQTLRAASPCAKGDPEAPLAPDEIIAKADFLLRHGGLGQGGVLIDQILALAEDGPPPPLPITEPVAFARER